MPGLWLGKRGLESGWAVKKVRGDGLQLTLYCDKFGISNAGIKSMRYEKMDALFGGVVDGVCVVCSEPD